MTPSLSTRFYLLTLMIFFSVQAFCFHIAGGEITYRWLTGNTYQIKLTLYRDCSNPMAADFDNSIIVAVYNKANNALVDTMVMNLGFNDSLTLSGAGCVAPPQVCMQYGNYLATVSLPANAAGYYVVWERCCRNNTILNLINPQNDGMVFYAELPDPSLHSSSPLFNSAPLPYICVNQFFKFGFQASDADGDSLVYSLITPSDGGHTSQSDPNPFSAGGIAPYPAPYTNASWTPGYSLSNICGSPTPLTINSKTGEIEVTPNLQGIYALAVEVREYRNGVFIGLIRREIEFTVIVCSGNIAPQITQLATSVNSINVYATDTINFELKIDDPNGDSIYLIHSGDIFQNSPAVVIDPPYAVTSDTSGLASIVTYFTWNTGCQHASANPYHVRYEASDNGCPLALTNIRKYDITVSPTPKVKKSNLLCIQLLDSNALKITRVSDTSSFERYFNHFTLYRSVNGSAFLPYKLIFDINPLEIFDSAAFNNRTNDYCYMLVSFNVCGYAGENSDTLCSVSHINLNRNYIESVTVAGENNIQLQWEPFKSGPYSTYYIYKMKVGDPQLQMMETVSNYDKFYWNDNNVFTGKYSYCYAMMNKDVCGNLSDTSLMAYSILLSGASKPFENILNWSPYINWKGGVQEYQVLRGKIFDNSLYDVIASLQTERVYFDRDLPGTQGSFTYKINAIEGPGGNGASSLSNEIEVSQAPYLYVPSAFTPNSDGVNDFFGSSSSFIEEFEIRIFNRWGQMVFYSNDLNEHWDGKFKGQKASSGVYFYKIKFKGFNEKNFSDTSGSITLLR